MLTVAKLLQQHCRHRTGPALAPDAVGARLRLLPHWRLEADALQREFRFGNYYETLAFVNALAYIVHREDHHPDLAVSYDRCQVRFSTHSAGGVTDNDFICAAKTDAVYAQRVGALYA